MTVKYFMSCGDAVRLAASANLRHDLTDVRYSHHFSSNPPYVFERICFFLRLYGALGSYRFNIGISWEGPGADPMMLATRPSIPFEFSLLNNAHDVVIPIHQFEVPGLGLLKFELTTEEDPETILAEDYLEVIVP